MKFKVGDKVKILNHKHGDCGKPGCKSFNLEGKMDGFIGKILTVIETGISYYELDGGGSWSWSDCMLTKAGKKEKVLPVQFVVVYDLVDRDPAKTFTSKKELNKWLKEARDDRNIVFSSIKVFEVKKEYEVRMSFALRKVK